jgi:hypothetical protein
MSTEPVTITLTLSRDTYDSLVSSAKRKNSSIGDLLVNEALARHKASDEEVAREAAEQESRQTGSTVEEAAASIEARTAAEAEAKDAEKHAKEK